MHAGAPEVATVVADVSTESGCKACIDTAMEEFGCLHAFFANAGALFCDIRKVFGYTGGGFRDLTCHFEDFPCYSLFGCKEFGTLSLHIPV